jgi:hypothetical protein
MSKCMDNYFFLIFLIFENMFSNNGYITYPSGAELDLQILCHSCQWHECLVHNFLHTYERFKAKSNTSLSLHLCELFDWPTIHALLWSSLLYFQNNFLHCPMCTFMHLGNPQMLVYLTSWKALFCKENSVFFIEQDFSSIYV